MKIREPRTYNKIFIKLKRLGFVFTKQETHYFLKHSATDTIVVLPLKLNTIPTDIFMLQLKMHLTFKGIVNDSTFEDLMYKSSFDLTNSKFEKTINRLENFIHVYQNANDKNKLKHKEYAKEVRIFIDALLTDGRITKDELKKYFTKYK